MLDEEEEGLYLNSMIYPHLPIEHKDLLISEVGWDLGVPGIAVSWLISVAGWRRWEKRCQDLATKVESFDFPNRRLIERHNFEITIASLYQNLMKTGRLFEEESFPAAYALAFCHSLWVIHRGLSDSGKRKFEGSIRDALNQEFGFSVLRCEVGAVLQLLDAGYKVVATDWESVERFDFLACSDEEELEVECKLLAHGTGDTIKPIDVERLLRHIRTDALLKALMPGRVVVCRIIADSVLPKTDGSLKKIVEMLLSVLRQRSTHARGDGVEIIVEDWDPGLRGPQSVFGEARRLTEATGLPAIGFADRERGAILSVDTRDRDIKTSYERSKRPLKEAVSQLSGKRRSCLFVKVEDLGPYDEKNHRAIVSLMQLMVEDVGKGKPHLQGIIFGLQGEPFSGTGTQWLWNPAREEEESSSAFDRLWRMARPFVVPELGQEWRNSWAAQWR